MTDSVTRKNIRLSSWLQFMSAVAGIIVLAASCSFLRLRLDLTEDRRYTLSNPTRKVLSGVKNDIYVQVYLDGDMPIPLKKLKRDVREMLDEFRVASGRKIDYEFINPSESRDSKQRQTRYQSLINKGLTPVNIQAGDAEGGSIQKIIFPGMLINCNGVEVPVNFLKNNPSISYEQNILHSVEGLEYELIQNIATLSSDTIYKVAFIEGHGELPEIETADLTLNLARFFTIDRGTIGGKPGILDKYAAVIIAGPEKEFNESDKLVLDQYIMNGGKVIWLFDEVAVNADSLLFGESVGLYRPLNIEDQIFMYGARVNPAIVQDMECMIIRLKVGTGSTNQQIVPAPWVYYPLLIPSAGNPVTRNLNRVKGEFTNYIDTVGLDPAIRKTILLSTSKNSRIVTPPLMISLKEAELTPDEKDYNRSYLPVAVLLEGVFPSAFRNRVVSNLTDDRNFKIRTESKKTKLIVVADADIIRNEVRHSGIEVTPLPLGQDKYTGQMFGNRDFLINCLNYLVDDHGIMGLRSRELKLRLLDRMKTKSEKMEWQLINLLGPILLVILAGLLYKFFQEKNLHKNLIMSKLVIRGVLISLAVGLIVILLFRERLPFGKNNSSFASEPDREITRIDLSANGKNESLAKKGDNWVINEGTEARKSGILFILRILREIEIKSPVSEELFRSEITDKGIEPVRIRVYAGRKQLKSFLVYKTSSNSYGNMMKIKASSKPFIVFVPGFDGDIGSAFTLNELFWQPYTVFNLLPSEIESVNFENLSDTSSSFLITGNNHHFTLSAGSRALTGWDSALVTRYLSYFARIPFEKWELEMGENEKKMVESQTPLYRITVTSSEGNKVILSLWEKMKEGEGGKSRDSDRLLGRLNPATNFSL